MEWAVRLNELRTHQIHLIGYFEYDFEKTETKQSNSQRDISPDTFKSWVNLK